MSDVGISRPQPLPPGVVKYNSLIQGGFSPAEANQWAAQQTKTLQAAGFKPSEVDDYWGAGIPHDAALASHVSNNLMVNAADDAKVATDPLHAFLAGWDISASGLTVNRKLPSHVLGQDPSIANRVLAGVGQFAGDAPFTVAGFFGGAAAGTAAGAAVPVGGETGVTEVIGAVGGAGFGAGATPEAARQVLLDAYKAKAGRIKTWQDALHVVASSLYETTKQGVIGTATNLVGGKAGQVALDAGMNSLASGGVNATAQVVTATGVGAAMDRHMPDAKDFTAAAILTLGLHGAGAVKALGGADEASNRVQHNIETLYRQTGVPPWEAAARANRDPVFRQELMAQDVNGDPVTPQFRNIAPEDPPPYKPAVRETGLMEDRQAGWRGTTDMKNVTPFKPADRSPQPSMKLLPRANPDQVYATDVPHAMSLLRQLEGSSDASVSPAGAIGRYQIMPGTARQYMGKDFDVTTLHDPGVNETVATRIVSDLYKRYNGDMNAISIAYNAGPGRAGQYMKAGPGSALVAIPDKTMRGGIRYESEPARRDESFLPTETQHYLANERRRMGNAGAEAPGGGGADEAPPRVPSYEVAGREGGGAGGGGGGDEPPASVGGEGDRWGKASESDLTDEILKNIGEQPQKASVLNLDRMMGQFVSELTPARNIDSRLVNAKEMNRDRDLGAEDMFRQTYASDQRAGFFVRYGAIDPISLSKVEGSKSIMDAVAQVKKDGGNMDGFTAYMLARRTMDKAAQGIETGFNPDAAAALTGNKKAVQKYAAGTEIWNGVMDDVLRYSQGSGVHSEAQIAAMMRDNPAFISMRRIMGDDEAFAPGGGRTFRASDALRKMEGSDRQIVDPIAATIDNIRLIIKMADRNRAIGHIVGMAEANPALGLKQLPYDPQATLAEAGSSVFKPYGLEPEAGTYDAPLAQKASKGWGPNDFVFYRDGVPERWTAKDPALAALLRGADSPGQANVVMKTLQTFAGLERSGIVVSPDFPTKVQLRHQITAFIMDPLHPPPFVTWLRGIGHVIGQDDVFQDAMAKGAFGVALADMDTNWLARDMDKVFEETGTWDGVANVVKHPLQFAQLISEKLDAAARVGYIKGAEEKGIEPIKAATMSRKAYLDYAEKATSAIANGMSQIVPFFRPHVLGMKQFGEAMGARPGSTLAYGAMAVAAPIASLYALNTLQDQFLPDDRKFANLPQWQKDNYFISPEIGGARIRLRLPPGLGFVMGGMMNRLLDYSVGKDAHAFEGWAKKWLEEYVPPILPTIAQTPIEVITNHSFYSGQPLIPGSMEKASGYMQYTAGTSETGKALSRALGPPGLDVLDFSPIQFDAFVKGWTGTIGGTALKALDVPFHDTKKPWELNDIPFVGSFFTRNPGLSAQPIQTFYEQMSKLEAHEADFALAMKRAEGGNASEIDLTAEAGQYAQAVAPIKQAIAVQSAVVQGIAGNKEMTAVEKRQAIDAMMPQIIDTARQGIKVIDGLPKKGAAEEPTAVAPPPAPDVNAPAAGRVKDATAPPAPGANRGMIPSD